MRCHVSEQILLGTLSSGNWLSLSSLMSMLPYKGLFACNYISVTDTQALFTLRKPGNILWGNFLGPTNVMLTVAADRMKVAAWHCCSSSLWHLWCLNDIWKHFLATWGAYHQMHNCMNPSFRGTVSWCMPLGNVWPPKFVLAMSAVSIPMVCLQSTSHSPRTETGSCPLQCMHTSVTDQHRCVAFNVDLDGLDCIVKQHTLCKILGTVSTTWQ
jgi:hypothetical protein